jgi:AraC-like DNA-binding protein
MIGKTRQKSTAEIEEVFDPEVGRARGMLRRQLPAGKMRHSRRRPAADLSPWIAHYWMIGWDLRGCPPQHVESLPHPNVHLIFESHSPVIAGVQTKKFSRTLEGQSKVFGVKFKPGAFRPFLGAPVSKLADRTIPATRVFGKEVLELADVVFSGRPEETRVAAANAFFRKRMPPPDETLDLAGHLVERILQDVEIRLVDDLVRVSGINKRSLQRIFNEYVGVSPKWVIRRYRLHELIEKFNSGITVDLSQLALDLGYFDQAHLINDFKSVVGYSPTQYQKLVSKNS